MYNLHKNEISDFLYRYQLMTGTNVKELNVAILNFHCSGIVS